MKGPLSTAHIESQAPSTANKKQPCRSHSPRPSHKGHWSKVNLILIKMFRITHSERPSLKSQKSRILSRATNDLRILSTLSRQQLHLTFSGHRYRHVLTPSRPIHPHPMLILCPSKFTFLTLFRQRYSIQLIEKLKQNSRLNYLLLERLSKKLLGKMFSVRR